MVKRVSLFQTADGETFETEALAKEHEAKIAAKSTIAALLKKLKVDGSFIALGETDSLMLDNFLLDNRVALLEALGGKKAEKKTRGPRKQKATPATPATATQTAPAEEVLEQKQPEPAAAGAGDSDAQLDSLVAELGA